MMMHYEKPDILRVDNLNEGVYLASGDTQETKAVCKSIYMLGVFHKPNSSNPNGGTNMEVCGCQGCPAGDDGDECGLIKGYVGDYNKDFRPAWERRGESPDKFTYGQ